MTHYFRRLSLAARWGVFVACPVAAVLYLAICIGMRT